MSTFYAAFPDATHAQLMVRHLMNDGIELDDISLVAHADRELESNPGSSTGDASYFVGRPDDPTHDLVDRSTPDADYEAVEMSRVGGGISTSNRETNVDSVDQMEDSQTEAEDQTWPRGDTSASRHELDDLDRALRTGFPTPVAPLDQDRPESTESDRPIEAMVVPGVGLVAGGGDLATAAFDWKGNGKIDSSAFLTYLQDEGVPPVTANDLLSQFGNGGALLAVALAPEIDEQALENVAERYGAVSTGWYGAPRY